MEAAGALRAAAPNQGSIPNPPEDAIDPGGSVAVHFVSLFILGDANL